MVVILQIYRFTNFKIFSTQYSVRFSRPKRDHKYMSKVCLLTWSGDHVVGRQLPGEVLMNLEASF